MEYTPEQIAKIQSLIDRVKLGPEAEREFQEKMKLHIQQDEREGKKVSRIDKLKTMTLQELQIEAKKNVRK